MQKLFLCFTFIAMTLSACGPSAVPATQTPTRAVLPATPTIVQMDSPPPTVPGGEVRVACNNTLSDAAQINDAIQHSDQGAEIVIAGPCMINETIKLIGDRSYRGTSRTGAVLKQADGANLVALLASDTFLEDRDWVGTPFSIRQMTLDGNSEKNQGALTDGIIIRSWSSSVEDMVITDMSNNGIHLVSDSLNGVKLSNTYVNGVIAKNLIDRSGHDAVHGEQGVADLYLVDNYLAFSGDDGVHLENAAGWVIERNHIYGVPHHAIYAWPLWGTTISDNYIEGFGETDEAGTWYGIYANLQGDTASTIAGNRIFRVNDVGNPESTYRYLALAVNYDTGVASLTGNVIRGRDSGDEVGIFLDTGLGHHMLLVSAGNAVADVSVPRQVIGDVQFSDGY